MSSKQSNHRLTESDRYRLKALADRLYSGNQTKALRLAIMRLYREMRKYEKTSQARTPQPDMVGSTEETAKIERGGTEIPADHPGVLGRGKPEN